ncbi:WD and tetratricopeptide repeats protein 1-like [Paramacrobiotus metropolitanus]|uniref:WD and tetratricopeptide repeats protein 1-like n=1 Tax=Paramacrobiotus metropolitanus TaxID=2943436 RepID=UPI00244647DB|nr:WD and tetratricopeptide repeats protein 1-like [Paramacrobiotus metropolitanus]
MDFPHDIWSQHRSPYGPFGIRNSVAVSFERQLGLLSHEQVRIRQQFTDDLVARLGLSGELRGHEGCVNCLEWSQDGSLLASGSDDCKIRIWKPFLPHPRRSAHVINSGHLGNIFGVKFLPDGSDRMVLSCAADMTVRVHDMNFEEVLHVFSCHVSRVKRLATSLDSPSVFWSAGEDGLVLQYDLREPRRCDQHSCRDVLINLNAYTQAPEIKSIASNPVRMEYLAVGATDCYTRVYDRRMLTLQSIKYPMIQEEYPRRHSWLMNQPYDDSHRVLPPGCVRYFTPGHLPDRQARLKTQWRSFAITDVRFSANGQDILSNIGGEQIYLFNLNSHDKVAKVFSTDTLPEVSRRNVTTMNAVAERLKNEANDCYHRKDYNHAVETYHRALQYCATSSVLYANRAVALLKRKWDGDCYQALLDSYKAFLLDPKNDKAVFRLINSLHGIGRSKEAQKWLEFFRMQHASDERNLLTTESFVNLERDIAAAVNTPHKNGTTKAGGKNSAGLGKQETAWRTAAVDYERRFVGHCNTTTDIKEANFLGQSSQFIMAGSDDGSFYIWDRDSTNLLKILKGDTNIVNCLQPHPFASLIATSGIDSEIRLWSSLAVDDEHSRHSERTDHNIAVEEPNFVGMQVEDVNRATNANQRRMNADPWSMLLSPFIHGNQNEGHAGIVHAGDCVQQ